MSASSVFPINLSLSQPTSFPSFTLLILSLIQVVGEGARGSVQLAIFCNKIKFNVFQQKAIDMRENCSSDSQLKA